MVMEMEHNKDSGFTLVELIVTICIIAVISVVCAINFTYVIKNIDKKQVLESISSALDSGRYTAMSSKDDNVSVQLVKKDDVYYMDTVVNDEIVESERLCASKHIIYLVIDGTSYAVKDHVYFTFDKATGAFTSIEYDSAKRNNTLSASSVELKTSKDDTTLTLALLTGRTILNTKGGV